MTGQEFVFERLKSDLEEMLVTPVPEVSAAPLKKDLLEWHCNLRLGDVLHHLILFFPPQYPFSAPRLEFVPRTFLYNNVYLRMGRKGMQLCLSLFHDQRPFLGDDTKLPAWSPAYTIQTILLNVLAYLEQNQAKQTCPVLHQHNLQLSKEFKCPDCGHTYNNPAPRFHSYIGSPKIKTKVTFCRDELVDYISKEMFVIQKPRRLEQLWGFGLGRSLGRLCTPLQFMTGRSFFGMKKAVGFVLSVQRQELEWFLPLYIHHEHGSCIDAQFECTIREISKSMMWSSSRNTCIEDLILKVLTNLMSSSIREMSEGCDVPSDQLLHGFFMLHRLFLWAADSYPDLQKTIDAKIQDFLKSEENRRRSRVPGLADWLMLLVVSSRYRWLDVAQVYLEEQLRRMTLWAVDQDWRLGLLNTSSDYRLKETFRVTDYSRKFMAFLVTFLAECTPPGMTRRQVMARYDQSMGFATQEVMDKLKEKYRAVQNIRNFQEWFQLLQLPAISDEQLCGALVDALKFCLRHTEYRQVPDCQLWGWKKVLHVLQERDKHGSHAGQQHLEAGESLENDTDEGESDEDEDESDEDDYESEEDDDEDEDDRDG